MVRPIDIAIIATQKKMHWKEWKRMKRFRLYGSMTKKMIGGIIVT